MPPRRPTSRRAGDYHNNPGACTLQDYISHITPAISVYVKYQPFRRIIGPSEVGSHQPKRMYGAPQTACNTALQHSPLNHFFNATLPLSEHSCAT
jgi:hypothetical protein